ncbi:MAG: DUF3791 domain-containing protein [Planctomycetota bacterium]|jgi:hypothetical protein|nr:DUF3791 domain-containing protein [Planctomycetota bacterium]
MKTDTYIKNYVYDGVVNEYAKLAGVPLRDAFDKLYKSRLYSEIRRGVSDMHCRSDGYLAEELLREQTETADINKAKQ